MMKTTSSERHFQMYEALLRVQPTKKSSPPPTRRPTSCSRCANSFSSKKKCSRLRAASRLITPHQGQEGRLQRQVPLQDPRRKRKGRAQETHRTRRGGRLACAVPVSGVKDLLLACHPERRRVAPKSKDPKILKTVAIKCCGLFHNRNPSTFLCIALI